MKDEERKYVRTLGKGVLPEGQVFKCAVCPVRGRHYNVVQMSDGTIAWVGNTCLKRLMEQKPETSETGAPKQEETVVLPKEKDDSKKTVNMSLPPGERGRICIEISFEKEGPSIS